MAIFHLTRVGRDICHTPGGVPINMEGIYSPSPPLEISRYSRDIQQLTLCRHIVQKHGLCSRYLLSSAVASHDPDVYWPQRSGRHGSKVSSEMKCHGTIFSFSHDPVRVLPRIVAPTRLLHPVYPIGRSMPGGGLVEISFQNTSVYSYSTSSAQ